MALREGRRMQPSAEFCGRALRQTPENSACGAHLSAPFLRLNMMRKTTYRFSEKIVFHQKLRARLQRSL